MREPLQSALLKTIDGISAVSPRPVPQPCALHNCKIISHRGENDNRQVIENTLQAFANARAAGNWGIECDLRWSRDLVPLISHDASCERLFGDPALLHTLDFMEIRRRFPLIPSLAELLDEFGGNTHLMIEIKADYYPQPAHQKQVLQNLLSSLQPGQDYHFLLLDPVLAEHVDFLPRDYCVLVAEFNMRRLSKYGLEHGFGGLSGHFLLLDNKLKQRHWASGQQIGTGFISSRNCLFRELNRGIEWIFSNDAARIQKIRDSHL
jgi:glycerophosphoryl diester phosphodiesterase